MRECRCGCGKEVSGNRKYAYGHAKLAAEKDKTERKCKCGCGFPIAPFDKHGRPKEYLSGHNGRKYDHKDTWAVQKAWTKRNREWVNNNRQERSRKRKKLLMVEKGNQCCVCGLKYDGTNGSVFDFHHRDPSEKEFSIAGNYNNKKLEVLQEELVKCDMLCSNCHRIHHNGKW